MIEDTIFDETTWIKIPGEKGAKHYFLGNIYMDQESNSTANDIRKKFGETAVDVHNIKDK